jgi:hypothetical protein
LGAEAQRVCFADGLHHCIANQHATAGRESVLGCGAQRVRCVGGNATDTGDETILQTQEAAAYRVPLQNKGEAAHFGA